jgi:CubicO group peptidase (beta-lactamase class C family)
MIIDQSTNVIEKFLSKEPSDKFNRLYNYVSKIKKQISASASALVVIQKNKVIGEWYEGHDPLTGLEISEKSRFNVFSTRKSYIGLVVAILLKEKKIRDIDDFVTDYIDNLDQDLLQGVTIRHFVTHTHGLDIKDGKIIKNAPAGTVWDYNDGGLTLLYKIISKTSGSTVNQILKDYVFNPLQFKETGWETTYHSSLVADVFETIDEPKVRLEDNTGFDRNLFVSARELAHWGYFHLNKGKIDNHQVLPRELFDKTTSIQTPKEMKSIPQNGFFWFLNENGFAESELGEDLPVNAFQILGASGCTCLVIPEYDAVAVRMYNKRGNPPEYDYLRDIKDFGNIVNTLLIEEDDTNEKN